MGMLFLIAGTEIDVQEVHGRAGRRSLLTWLACFGIGLAVSWVAVAASGFCSFKYSYGDFCFNKYIVTIKNRKKIIQTQKNIFFCFLFILFTSFFI